MCNYTTALITGATGGIGRSLCHEFARHGHDLIITARSGVRLDELACKIKNIHNVNVTAIAADLNQPDAAKKLFIEIRDRGLNVNYLVNNAGFGLGGYFFQNKLSVQEAMVRVNISAPTRLMRMFIPQMIKNGDAKILNVASTGAFVPGPHNSVYCASKAYILSLSQAIRYELKGSGITVSTLCPGATRTGFAHRADMETTRLFNYGVMPPVKVARAAYYGMMSDEKLIIPGAMNKAVVAAVSLAPSCVSTRLSGFIQRQFTC